MTEPATKDNVEPMVRRSALKSVAKGLADTAPPAAPTIPALSPLSDYLADEERRQRNAVDEKAFREDQVCRLEEDYRQRTAKLNASHERELLDNARKHASELLALSAHIAEQEAIIASTTAAIAASPPLESASATMQASETD